MGTIDISAIEWLANGIELFGVVTILAGAVVATTLFSLGSCEKQISSRLTLNTVQIGRAILLGLEFLVAGDIIATILIEPTITRAGALGIIVLIRTFLSFSLETEIEGCWPWERAHSRNDTRSDNLDPDGFR